MLAALTQADAVTWLSIVAKALAYAATLSAVGSVLVLALLPGLGAGGRDALRRTAALSALAASLFTVLRLPLRASFLMGGMWDGAMDPAILGMVAESPLGTSAALRLAGLALILCVLWRGRTGLWFAVPGALLASASFAFRGHALSEPQAILGTLVTLHILCLAFWIGGLAPLLRSLRTEPPALAGALAEAFGRQAVWAVGVVLLGGAIALALLGAARPSALASPYGQMFALKLLLVAGVLAMAALNRLTLTPALLAARPDASARMRRSIRAEAALIAGVLLVTAALTTVSSPPGPGEDQMAALVPPVIGQVQDMTGDAS
ncbi:copper-binding protein [Meridianimarinicoccus roseus]|uniref:Copper-binding protein n=1 Tax=Meridianimarinicoccus roseus TaxID=2072018 RepID=A0A2V2LGN9_9RHOB|nr:CopD family protein [Meridianimarinicoccus roseus]PWR02347.1 copper-binding protein [Meridianimarinicoccus roseus]